MPMSNEELKAFIELTFQNVVKEVNRVGLIVESQADWIRRIELNSTTRIAELQKDMNGAFDQIRTVDSNMRAEISSLKSTINSVSQSLNHEEDARTLAVKSIADQLVTFKETEASKWSDQKTENDKNKTLRAGMWLIVSAVVVDILLRVVNFVMTGTFGP